MNLGSEKVFTIGELANILNEPPERVSYITRKLRLEPICRVGTFRMFSESQIELIKNGLYNIQIRSK